MELSKYLTKMLEFVPDVICFTVLIDNCCKLDNLEGAKRLFWEMIERGIQPDTVAYTALIGGYSSHNFVEAETFYNKMLLDGNEPDARIKLALKMVKCRTKRFQG